jgi:hypothetical protein
MVDKRLLIGVIIVAIVILFSLILTTKGLIDVNPPLPVSPEKARFLRVLSCAYAMCVKETCDYSINDIGFLDKDNEKGCGDKCKDFEEWQRQNNIPVGRKCGPDYKLEFVTEDEFTYHSDYHVSNRLETDVMRFSYKWTDQILGHDSKYCFGRELDEVTLGGHTYDKGCGDKLFVGTVGLCEGVLMRSRNCDWGEGSAGNSRNTGHIWIGPGLDSQCLRFENDMYLASCKFDKTQTVDVWAKEDMVTLLGLGSNCPEIIICSHE